MDILARALDIAAEHAPADPITAGAVDLRQARIREADDAVTRKRCERYELGVVIDHLVVDLVGEHQDAAVCGNVGDLLERFPVVDSTARVIRVDDHDSAGSVVNEFAELRRVRHEVVLRQAVVIPWHAAVQHDRRGPQRVVGTGHEDLVARVQQRPQRQVDQLADAVADEHLVGADIVDAAVLLLHHHRLARRENALLVTVRFRLAEVLDHRQPHGLRGSETEQTGVTDVQRYDFVTALLEFVRVVGELAADLVLDLAERAAGGDAAGGSLALVQGRNVQIVPACLSLEMVFAE